MKVIEFLKAVRKIPSWDRKPYINDTDLEDLINQIDMVEVEDAKSQYEPYPILESRRGPKQYIPRGLLSPHEQQARRNHGQSLSRLAQRGGLSWTEALAIIEDKNWRDAEHDEKMAEATIRKMATEYMKEIK